MNGGIWWFGTGYLEQMLTLQFIPEILTRPAGNQELA
jgi:hypothetical protein